MKLSSFAFGIAILASSQSAMAMEQGRYEGPADGGWLSASVKGTAFEISVANERGCGGSGQGKIANAGKNRWIITLRDQGAACKLDIRKQGQDRYNIEENGCSYFHGASCSFSGFVKPARQRASPVMTQVQYRSFGGYECTDDCSGHKAGFEWAERNNINDEYDCVSNSVSFDEGCAVYVNDPYRDPDYDDDGNYIP